MRAIVQRRYGQPEDVLELRNIDKPAIGADEVLLRIRAASVSPDVWHVVTGRPYVLRIMGAGIRRPKNPVPGTDAAGVIESVGKNVTRLQPGDEVFGEIVRGHQWKNGGAYAEYAAAPETALEPKPASLTFEEAAAIPTSALIALDNLRRKNVQQGDSVLVNGAAGGVGIFAVQILRSDGARVTAVDSTEKLDMLRSVGADDVIDYTREDFTQNGEVYDFIVDIPGNRTFDDLKHSLAEDGRYVLIGHEHFDTTGGRWIGGTMPRLMSLAIRAPFGRGKRSDPAPKDDRRKMAIIAELAETGTIKAIVDATFPLDKAADALHHLETGHVKGKLVITI